MEEKFDNLRLFHIVLEGKKRDRSNLVSVFDQEALDMQMSDWMNFEMVSSRSSNEDREVKSYGGLFSEPVSAFLKEIRPAAPEDKSKLDTVFSMKNWPCSGSSQVKNELKNVEASFLTCYDVGQGLSTSLLAECLRTTLHYDIGTGVYRNAHTRIPNLILCNSGNSPIILSHWDTDHWAGARYCAPPSNPDVFLKRTWIAPKDLSIGPTHIVFAEEIIRSGGNILLWDPSVRSTINIKLADRRCLSLIKGRGKGRNESGIALMVKNSINDDKWLLTGDVEYENLFKTNPPRFVAMTVPHHGARLKNNSIVPSPSPQSYRRLIYSFGHGNSYKHPTDQCIDSHISFGWNHGSWNPPPFGHTIPGGDVLSTATRKKPFQHLGASIIGWNYPPLSLPIIPCDSQCNASLRQS